MGQNACRFSVHAAGRFPWIVDLARQGGRKVRVPQTQPATFIMAMTLKQASCKSLRAPAGRNVRQNTVRCQSALPSDPSTAPQRTSRRVIVGTGLATALISIPLVSKAGDSRVGEVARSEAEWRKILDDDAYYVLRQAGTERPYSSPLNAEKHKGTFVCAGCGAPLYSSEAKFESGTGWPSFFEPLPGAVDETFDISMFIPRTEIRCHRCQGHLGHVFSDGPAPTGLRYCMNGHAMAFKEA